MSSDGRVTNAARPDSKILDAEPWKERGPVDELIGLQQEAFRADSEGERGEFGSIVMEMSRIESLIGNHSEAAAYAYEAAEAFAQSGRLEDAISAQSTLAKESRTLDSPDMALSALTSALSLRMDWEGDPFDIPRPVKTEDAEPVLRLVRSFSAGYFSAKWTPHHTQDLIYPAPFMPRKTRLPSKDVADELNMRVWHLNAVREGLADETFDRTLFLVESISLELITLSRKAELQSRSRLGHIAGVLFGV